MRASSHFHLFFQLCYFHINICSIIVTFVDSWRRSILVTGLGPINRHRATNLHKWYFVMVVRHNLFGLDVICALAVFVDTSPFVSIVQINNTYKERTHAWTFEIYRVPALKRLLLEIKLKVNVSTRDSQGSKPYNSIPISTLHCSIWINPWIIGKIHGSHKTFL